MLADQKWGCAALIINFYAGPSHASFTRQSLLCFMNSIKWVLPGGDGEEDERRRGGGGFLSRGGGVKPHMKYEELVNGHTEVSQPPPG